MTNLNPASINLSRPGDDVATRCPTNELILNAGPGTNVDSETLSYDLIGDELIDCFTSTGNIDRGCSDDDMVGMDPAIEHSVDNMNPLTGLVSGSKDFGACSNRRYLIE